MIALRNKCTASETRYSQLERTLFAAATISNHRFGMSFEWIAETVNREFGVGLRTIRRDIAFLESLGILERDKSTFGTPVYRICTRSLQGGFISRLIGNQTSVKVD